MAPTVQGDGRVEDEGKRGSPAFQARGVGPAGVKVAVGELAGGLEPVEDMEVEVVTAGAAVEDESQDGDEGGEGDEGG